MSHLYTNLLTAVIIAIAAGTIFELWKQRHKLMADELDDDAKALCWRLVLFLVFPFIVWLDLRATLVATNHFGAWVKDWHYGLLWFSAVPQSLPHADLLIPVLFAGVLVQLLLVLCLLPSLFFRPHPFLATVITNTITLVIASNLILDPLLGFVKAGSSRWQIAYESAPRDSLLAILAVYSLLSVLFLFAVRSKRVRIFFADLTSPVLAEQLRIAISESACDRNNQFQICRLAVLYERAGMRSNAAKELLHLAKVSESSIYLPFLEGFLNYKRRNYKKARSAFEAAAALPDLNDALRATFFSAAACAAYGEGETEKALDLSQRSLEFDHCNLVARMVKVDAYMKIGKKELAGEEVLEALRQSPDFELEDRVPLNVELTLRQLFIYQKKLQTRTASRDQAKVASLKS